MRVCRGRACTSWGDHLRGSVLSATGASRNLEVHKLNRAPDGQCCIRAMIGCGSAGCGSATPRTSSGSADPKLHFERLMVLLDCSCMSASDPGLTPVRCQGPDSRPWLRGPGGALARWPCQAHGRFQRV